ncbi:MAG TPA: hypothetical protein PKE25_06725, partial [Novosphingobium sp.]|nr:hypothetical protein [Novosphingobium sp.]
MTREDAIRAAGLALLDPQAPALVRFPGLEQRGHDARVFLAARHDEVSRILCDEAAFSLCHYDELLAQVAGPTRYLVGEDDAARQLRLRLLLAAQAEVDRARGAADEGVPANLAPGYRDFVAAIARDEATAILDLLDCRKHTGEPINFVREYAFLLAYRMARRLVGIPAPDRAPGLVRLMMLARNLWCGLGRGGRWLPLDGELGVASTALGLQHPLFGHVFGTVVASPALLQAASRSTASAGLQAIDRAWAMPGLAPRESLLRAMIATRPQFADIPDHVLAVQARSVLFELTGALVLVVGKALADIAGLAVSARGPGAGIDWGSLGDLLGDEQAGRSAHDAAINEMLRLAGGARLVRTVRADMTWQGIALNAGDRIVGLIEVASLDPAA